MDRVDGVTTPQTGLSDDTTTGRPDAFALSYTGFDPGEEGLRETLTSTGNGYLCTRGAAEWEDADGVHYPGTYVHGLYDRATTMLGGVPVHNEDLVNLPNWLPLKLRIGGAEAPRRPSGPRPRGGRPRPDRPRADSRPRRRSR